MLSKTIEKKLNDQLKMEAQASHKYLAMANWCDQKGFAGAAKFLYEHSDEEHMHMMKLLNYIQDKDGKAVIPALTQPKSDFTDIKAVFEYGYDGEQKVTAGIYEIVQLALKEKDYTTHNFMQWYVNEQLEEENLYRTILDKITLIGEGGNALYLIDLEIEKLSKGDGGMASIEPA